MNTKVMLMLVKFFSRGSGSGESPVNYLLGDNRDREGASILRGNAEITRELINSTDYAKRYTSGCLSFEESYTAITDANKAKIMDDFENTLFPGLAHDQYNVLWVQHTDKNDRLELNFLIPNQELRSGKRLQPFYYVADMKRVNAFQTVTNLSLKLSDPHDPNKKRVDNPYFSRSANLNDVAEKDYTDNQKRLIKHQEEKARLTKHIYDLNDDLSIRNREDIKAEIVREGCEITRVTKLSISIKSPKFNKNIRLDDPIFREGINLDDYTAKNLSKKLNKESEDYKGRKGTLLEQAQEVLEEGLAIKTKWHAKRFESAVVPKPYELVLDEPAPVQKPLESPKPQNKGNDPGFDFF